MIRAFACISAALLLSGCVTTLNRTTAGESLGKTQVIAIVPPNASLLYQTDKTEQVQTGRVSPGGGAVDGYAHDVEKERWAQGELQSDAEAKLKRNGYGVDLKLYDLFEAKDAAFIPAYVRLIEAHEKIAVSLGDEKAFQSESKSQVSAESVAPLFALSKADALLYIHHRRMVDPPMMSSDAANFAGAFIGQFGLIGAVVGAVVPFAGTDFHDGTIDMVLFDREGKILWRGLGAMQGRSANDLFPATTRVLESFPGAAGTARR